MKNLITSIASILLFSICLLQFAAEEATYAELVTAERIITKCEFSCERDEFAETVRTKLKKAENIDKVKVTDTVKGFEISYEIRNVIGPDKALGISEEQNKAVFKRYVDWETS